jgi:PAS domain S-box-containing protein
MAGAQEGVAGLAPGFSRGSSGTAGEASEAFPGGEEWLARLVEVIPDGIQILNSAGRYIFANAAWERITGLPRGELTRRFYDNPPVRVLTLEGESFPLEQRPFARAMRSGRAVYGVEMIIERPDKSRAILAVSAAPIRDAAGHIVYVVQSFSDITVRKQAEQALQQSEERYRLLTEVCPDAILVNKDNKIVFVNKACLELLGATSPEQLLGKSPLDFTHPGDHALVRERIRRQLELGEAVGLAEERIFRLDGKPLIVEVSAAPITVGGARAIQAVLRDVTARKRAEEERRKLEAEIQHAQRLDSLGVLAGGIAHDFNNLLVGVLGNADLALLDMEPESPARQRVEDIRTAGIRASELTRQLLAYSGKGRFVVEALNLNELIEEMAHLLRVSISKRVSLQYHLADDLPAIEADAAQIQQIIMNLITNASDAIGDKAGTITLATGMIEANRQYLSSMFLNEDLPEGQYIYFEVSDTGCGMDEQTKARIFEPFFSTKFTGRGLGLSAVLGIVRGHAGAIKVYSELGKGTAFKVLLPSSGRQVRARKDLTEGQQEELRGTGLILVADDDEYMRRVTKTALERQGYEVLTASDGPQCLELFRQHMERIVLVILDMTMPSLSGEETFRKLRQIQPEVRVLLTSGYNEQDATNHFVGKGLAGFLQKPFRMDALVAKVAEVRAHL